MLLPMLFVLVKHLELHLKEKGLGILNRSPDFSKLSDQPLRVASVIQKAFIEVAENGVEAAAATAVLTENGATPGPVTPPTQLRFDQPFLFVIHDQATKAILFIGRLNDPR